MDIETRWPEMTTRRRHTAPRPGAWEQHLAPHAVYGGRCRRPGVLAEHGVVGEAIFVQEATTLLRIAHTIVEFEDRHAYLAQQLRIVLNEEQFCAFNVAFE